MSRFTSLLNLGGLSSGQAVGLDIGSQNIKILHQNRVVTEATCVVFQETTKEVITVGKTAEQQAAILVKGLQSQHPIEEGKVQDIPLLAQYLEQIIPASTKRGARTSSPGQNYTVTLAVPVEQTSIQKQAYQQALREARLQLGSFVSSAQAAFKIAQKESLVGTTACLVDYGAAQTQISVFVGGELRYKTLIPLGGRAITQLVKDIVRARYHCDISWHTAEKIKKEIGAVHLEKKQTLPHLVIRGRDILSNTPQSLTLQASDFSEEILGSVQQWIAEVQVFLGQLPGASVSEILEGGIVTYGGSSQLRGLQYVMEDKLHCEVAATNHPQVTVAEGLWHDKD